jgi:hypothetical protein
MSWPIAGKLSWKLRIVDSMTVDGIEAYYRAPALRHHENTKVVALLNLVRSLLKKVIDLLDAARKSRPIMF